MGNNNVRQKKRKIIPLKPSKKCDYNYAEIQAIWHYYAMPKLKNTLTKENITSENLLPVITPEQEITLAASDLQKFLTKELKRNVQERILFIPLKVTLKKTHWIALVSYINKKNQIIYAWLINSLDDKPQEDSVIKTEITRQLRLACPSFTSVQQYVSYVQNHPKNSSALCLENAIEMVKRIYFGTTHQPFVTTFYDEEQINQTILKQLKKANAVRGKEEEKSAYTKHPAEKGREEEEDKSEEDQPTNTTPPFDSNTFDPEKVIKHSDNLYKRLGVEDNASSTTIKKAYRNLATMAHPDKGGSHEWMRDLNEAYEKLGDSSKREEFDISWDLFHEGATQNLSETATLMSSGLSPSQKIKAQHAALVRQYETAPLTKESSQSYFKPFHSTVYDESSFRDTVNSFVKQSVLDKRVEIMERWRVQQAEATLLNHTQNALKTAIFTQYPVYWSLILIVAASQVSQLPSISDPWNIAMNSLFITGILVTGIVSIVAYEIYLAKKSPDLPPVPDAIKFKNPTQHGDIFSLIDEKTKYAEFLPSQSLALNDEKSLTPAIAIKLFRKFLRGKFYSSTLNKIFTYFTRQLDSIKLTHARSPEILLYEGMKEIFSRAMGSAMRGNQQEPLLFSIKKITDYAKQTSGTLTELLVTLFQDRYFRALFSQGLHAYWRSGVDILNQENRAAFDGRTTAHIKLEAFERLIEIDRSITFNQSFQQGVRIVRLLQQFDKDLYDNEPKDPSAPYFRKMVYQILDWIPGLSSRITYEIFANIFLQAGIFLQCASTVEPSPEMQMADEQLALQMYNTAFYFARRTTPNAELYAYLQGLKYIASFQFTDNYLTKLVPALQEHALKVADFFPFFEAHRPNITFFIEESESRTLMLMRHFLQVLVRRIQNKKSFDHSESSILYQAYEACIKNWYQGYHDPILESRFRWELMSALLREKNWGASNFSHNVTSPWTMISRDSEGWMRPGDIPFPSHPAVEKYRSLNGIKFNTETGEITFFLTPWHSKDPAYTKVLTNFDITEMIAKNFTGAYFSLDPIIQIAFIILSISCVFLLPDYSGLSF